jgi:GGDEF domain-containing protein
VAVSLGVACTGEYGRNEESLLRRADVAMYAAKDRGGATFRLADPAANTSKGPGQAIGALRPVRRAAPASGGQRRLLPPGVRG